MISQPELEFRAHSGGQTQNQKLAAYFQANPGQDIPMPELARVITPTGIGAAVHSRIADLRKPKDRGGFGMAIENRRSRNQSTGLVESWYRYQPDSSS